MKLSLNCQFGLYEKDGKAYCDSLQVAQDYEKEHKDIIAAIEGKERAGRNDEIGLIDGISQSEGNPADYFIKVKYKDSRNRQQPKYLMSRDGFMLLVMGFTGVKALRHKLAYISRFNQMEEFIHSLYASRFEFPAFTDAVLTAHEEPKPYHFSNEINMIYKIVLGADAKGYRQQNGIEKGEAIKPFLSLEQIQAIEQLQRIDIGLIEAGLTFEARKSLLYAKYDKSHALAS